MIPHLEARIYFGVVQHNYNIQMQFSNELTLISHCIIFLIMKKKDTFLWELRGECCMWISDTILTVVTAQNISHFSMVLHPVSDFFFSTYVYKYSTVMFWIICKHSDTCICMLSITNIQNKIKQKKSKECITEFSFN